jgi:hypothetical protein
MSFSAVPIWAWVSALLLLVGLLIALQPLSTRLRLTGLGLCQIAVLIACLFGWGVLGSGEGLPAPPTAKAAFYVALALMTLTFLVAWVLGRRAWSEGLLAARSPKPGHRRQL